MLAYRFTCELVSGGVVCPMRSSADGSRGTRMVPLNKDLCLIYTTLRSREPSPCRWFALFSLLLTFPPVGLRAKRFDRIYSFKLWKNLSLNTVKKEVFYACNSKFITLLYALLRLWLLCARRYLGSHRNP